MNRNQKRKRFTAGDKPGDHPTKRMKLSPIVPIRKPPKFKSSKNLLAESIVDYHALWVGSCKFVRRSNANKIQKSRLRRALVYKIRNRKNKIIALVGKQRGQVICRKVRDRLDDFSESEDDENSDESDDEEEDEENTENEEETEEIKKSELEQKLMMKGIPMKIESGCNMVKDVPITWTQTHLMGKEEQEYWTEFAQQIDSDDHSLLFEVITELLDGLKKLSPHRDHQKLNQLLDLKVIQKCIEKPSIDANVFYRIFKGIWSQIKSLHLADEDEEWDQWHDSMISKMNESGLSWGMILAEILNIFTHKMDRIKQQIETICKLKGDDMK